MDKHAVEKSRFVIRYVSDQYKTQQMSDKVSLENGGMMFFPNCEKVQICVITLLIIMFVQQGFQRTYFVKIMARLKKCLTMLLMTFY